MEDARVPPAARIAAALEILHGGWGKPKETVDVTDKTPVSWLDLVKASTHPDVEARVQPMVEAYALPPPKEAAVEPR
jgi:hypothetical protein